MEFETENIEFKSRFTEEIYKEVIAFANTEGGFVYVGIDDTGEVVGLKDVDDEYTRITNGIRDAILPDVTMFVHYTIQNNRVIRIAVNEGTDKPYYLKSKGLKPSGVYVRQGASSVQASFDRIRTMIKENDGDEFEQARSLEQTLTFNEATRAFRYAGLELTPEKYRALGITVNSVYTNLALIISDQCPYTTKIAVFNDETCTLFSDSREFGGSVFRQFEDAAAYLRLCNRTRSDINGMLRMDSADYPEEAIREALLNALVHRDYSFSGSIIINVNDLKTEFISLGGLLPGLSEDDIRIGISQPRNKNLAEIFHRLHLIESYGTGIRRIFKLYENCPEKPVIEATPGAFKITLPNMNRFRSTAKSATDTQTSMILDFIRINGTATDAQLETLLNVKRTRLYTIIRQMREKGLICVQGKGADKRYSVIAREFK